MDNLDDSFDEFRNAPSNYKNLHAQKLQSLCQSYQTLESKYKDGEDNLVNHQHKLDDAQKSSIEYYIAAVEEISIEKDILKSVIFGVEGVVREREEELLRRIDDGMREKECLEVEIYEHLREREELVRKIDVGMREKEGLLKEIAVSKEKNEDLEEIMLRALGVLGSIKESFIRVNGGLSLGEIISENGVEHVSNFEGKLEEWRDMSDFLWVLDFVLTMAKSVEVKLNKYYHEKEGLLKEIEEYKEQINVLEEERRAIVEHSLKGLKSLQSIKDSSIRVSECLDENELEVRVDHEHKQIKEESLNFEAKLEALKEVKIMSRELGFVLNMATSIEEKLSDYQEKVKKEMRKLKSSVVSLTEENRDVNTLLRIALVEKEAVEKSLNRFKGNNYYEQKRVALLQIAERGLQRVGFGFMMGGAANEQSEQQKKENEQTLESMSSNSSIVLDVSSECEEEAVNLASTVEKMMKNLRLEITELRRALEESRLDTERLQSFTEKQGQQITEQTIYIKELEDRERILSLNVEQLLSEIKAAEEDAERWREACELEVEAGKFAAEERDNMVSILQQELAKTRAAFEVSNKKIKLKEELAVAAMAAQSAAERSLQLADSRATELRARIEELTRQMEEVESREKNGRRKTTRICWPWQALRMINPANALTSQHLNGTFG